MKKILLFTLALLVMFGGNTTLHAAAAAAQQEGKRPADDDESDDGKRSKLGDNPFYEQLKVMILKEKGKKSLRYLRRFFGDEERCQKEIVKRINHESYLSNKRLFDAIYSSDIEQVEMLVTVEGINPNIKMSPDGNTPLCKAVFCKESITITQLLIEAGANINAQGELGLTPVHLALKINNNELVKKLLAAGALVGGRDRCGFTLLDLSRPDLDKEILRILIGKRLFEAIENNNEVLFKCSLINKDGIDLDFTYSNGLTPLALAEKLNRVEMVRLIKQKQFFDAIEKNDIAVFNALITAGADIHSQDLRGLTPLHAAAQAGNTQAVEVLLKAGADIYAPDKFGNTPFSSAIYAAGKGNINPARISLLEMLADAELKEAVKESNPLAVKELIAKGRWCFGADRIKPTSRSIHEALVQAQALIENPISFTDDRMVEDVKTKRTFGYKLLSAQEKEVRNKEIIEFLTQSIKEQ